MPGSTWNEMLSRRPEIPHNRLCARTHNTCASRRGRQPRSWPSSCLPDRSHSLLYHMQYLDKERQHCSAFASADTSQPPTGTHQVRVFSAVRLPNRRLGDRTCSPRRYTCTCANYRDKHGTRKPSHRSERSDLRRPRCNRNGEQSPARQARESIPVAMTSRRLT